MRRITGLLTAAIIMAFASTASAATTVTSLTGDFKAGNSTVVLTDLGVQFGPYPDGGLEGGSLFYWGRDGKKLSSLTDLAFTARYNTANNTTVGVPYLRIFLENGLDAIYSPNTQSGAQLRTEENVTHTWNVLDGVVRYDDDCGDGVLDSTQTEDGGCSAPTDTNGDDLPGYGVSGAPWATLIADHGDERITKIVVSAGFSAGVDLQVMLNRLRVNSDEFVFKGVVPSIFPEDRSGVVVPPVATASCRGNTARLIKAQKRKGFKFISTSATLRGKKLAVSGRKIMVDLTNRPEGNYNVRIVTKYQKAGKLIKVKTTRNLSVACA